MDLFDNESEVQVINQQSMIEVINSDDDVIEISNLAADVITQGIQGPPGTPGAQGTGNTISGIAGQDLPAFTLVALSAGKFIKLDPTNSAHAPLYAGMTLTTVLNNAAVNVAQLGEVSGLSSLVQDQRYFVGLNGTLGTVPQAVGATWVKTVGFAVNATTILLVNFPSILKD